jgi:hypothetical protein
VSDLGTMSPPVSFQSLVVVVVQPDSVAAMFKSCGPPLRSISRADPSAVRTFFSPSADLAVGHPVEALSDVRCADARSAQISSPCGVPRSFQVSLYKVEPAEAVF